MMNRQLSISVFSALLAMYATPVLAENVAQAASLKEAITEGKPTINFKLRYENVNQDGKSDTGEAFTLRSLIGWKTKPFHDVSITAEVYSLSPLNDDYNDLKKGSPLASRTKYPVIADPEDYDFHQLYLEWTGFPDSSIKLGRQGMVLDNWRYVGDVRFRQNWQVFNGLSFVNKSLPNTEIALAHYEQVKQITTKIQDANIDIANVKYSITPSTSLVGYGYFVDWNGKALEASSNKTLGLRLDGSQKLNDSWKILYTAEYAKQDDYKDGSKLIDNDYYRVGAGAGYADWFLRIDQEKLSGNSDNKAFQTPLGTNHLFQGWADVFLTTPNEGIEDTILIAGGKVMDATIKAEYHFINSDRNFAKVGGGTGDKYGKEFDLGVYYKFTKQISASVEYANFKEDDEYAGARKRDIEKFWLTAIYAF
ncbi:MAG: hypothetical protein Q7T88_03115 [Methylotenera sp.]|nr:hypothetical protein [Methylotenera sp.]